MIHRNMSDKQTDKLSRYGEPAHLILLSLYSGPKHGYAIIQDVLEETGIKLGPGTLYGALTKLADQGLIEAAADTGDRRRPYRITDQGKQALASYVATWSRVMGIGKQRLAEQ
jgi:DNA-binding PadR family transcriptional regulator